MLIRSPRALARAGYAGLAIRLLRPMNSRVLRSCNGHEVFWPIVRWVSVNVMNNLAWLQSGVMRCFPNQAMLSDHAIAIRRRVGRMINHDPHGFALGTNNVPTATPARMHSTLGMAMAGMPLDETHRESEVSVVRQGCFTGDRSLSAASALAKSVRRDPIRRRTVHGSPTSDFDTANDPLSHFRVLPSFAHLFCTGFGHHVSFSSTKFPAYFLADYNLEVCH